MQLDPKLLEDRHVRLEPMADAHREDLRVACNADPATWTELYPYSMAGEHFDPQWTKMMGDVEAGRTIAFAVVADGRCGGITCYSGIDAANDVVEVGGTYYRPDLRGGAVNPAAKRLMLAHAFASGARRLVLRVDAINARSRAAVLRLGAAQDGILRQDRVTWTGRIRDTVIFSILANEWPAVRDGLDARLAKFG
ncbi:GNAT family protein [Phenylobacterium sp.]|jgi:RimJ/RimL family protein N-acetyltransferase|uniref:GNAT family N-acetyltransferase n=1 Tax=Phenylobacterium sp. TaxID=1871053 RepID=UPI002E372ADD|nr:GNAT family protein [Phenylobacterium sp.]HEX3363435.1 GNAT family protein [Phenylobacterium sp.]